MDEIKAPTAFLPAERADAETLRRQHAAVLGVPKLVEILDAVHDIVVFLNRERQIVHANKAAAAYIRAHGGEPELGARWGEAIRCERAADADCGTTEFCRNCGAARAPWICQFEHPAIEECRITQSGGDALDFRVTATRILLDKDEFTVFTAVDVGDEKRRQALQRTFFHDVMNTLYGVRGIIELMPDASPESRESSLTVLERLSEELIEEIAAQRDLLAAENRDLAVHPARLDSLSLLLEIVAAYREHPAAKGKTILVDAASSGVEMTSDRALLRRVLGNMIKNALEASASADSVLVGCAPKDGGIEFWVQNPAVLPAYVRLQIFQRSFSTKGAGRGLGAYSMKLLTERYLRGSIGFTSGKNEGTRFTARYPLTLAAKT